MIGIIFIAVMIFILGFAVGMACSSGPSTFTYTQKPEDKIVNEMKRQYTDSVLNRNNTSSAKTCISCGQCGWCSCFNHTY